MSEQEDKHMLQAGQAHYLASLKELAAHIWVAVVMRWRDCLCLGGHQVLQEDPAGQATCLPALLQCAAMTMHESACLLTTTSCDPYAIHRIRTEHVP